MGRSVPARTTSQIRARASGVDQSGWLHLKVREEAGRWWAAEVVSVGSFGFGEYAFEVDGAATDVDQSAVLGLFTWSDDNAFAHREIDIEISRWMDPAGLNGQCVVQPTMCPAQSSVLTSRLARRCWICASPGPETRCAAPQRRRGGRSFLSIASQVAYRRQVAKTRELISGFSRVGRLPAARRSRSS